MKYKSNTITKKRAEQISERLQIMFMQHTKTENVKKWSEATSFTAICDGSYDFIELGRLIEYLGNCGDWLINYFGHEEGKLSIEVFKGRSKMRNDLTTKFK